MSSGSSPFRIRATVSGSFTLRHVEGAGAHLAQGHDQGTGDEERQQQRGDEREQDDPCVGEGTRLVEAEARSATACSDAAEQSRFRPS